MISPRISPAPACPSLEHDTSSHRRRKGGGGGGGGARGLKPPLRMISHRNYLSWSGAENRDKDRDTLIEQSL